MSTLRLKMRPARAGALALMVAFAGQCQVPMSAQQPPAAPAPGAAPAPTVYTVEAFRGAKRSQEIVR